MPRTYDEDDFKDLKAEEWQTDLLKLNPEYVHWGPHEDYMWKEKGGWDSRQIHKTWEKFGPWELNDLNEIANFYFSVNRESVECEHCSGSGYSPSAKELADSWYSGKRWSDKLEQHEVDALWEGGRLNRDFKERPTAKDVNAWSKIGMGHDAINRWICIESKCKRLGVELHCNHCDGDGSIYTAEKAHVSLTLWILHPRKGCSRGVEITCVEKHELPEVFKLLKEAAERNAERFSKIPS